MVTILTSCFNWTPLLARQLLITQNVRGEKIMGLRPFLDNDPVLKRAQKQLSDSEAAPNWTQMPRGGQQPPPTAQQIMGLVTVQRAARKTDDPRADHTDENGANAGDAQQNDYQSGMAMGMMAAQMAAAAGAAAGAGAPSPGSVGNPPAGNPGQTLPTAPQPPQAKPAPTPQPKTPSPPATPPAPAPTPAAPNPTLSAPPPPPPLAIPATGGV